MANEEEVPWRGSTYANMDERRQVPTGINLPPSEAQPPLELADNTSLGPAPATAPLQPSPPGPTSSSDPGRSGLVPLLLTVGSGQPVWSCLSSQQDRHQQEREQDRAPIPRPKDSFRLTCKAMRGMSYDLITKAGALTLGCPTPPGWGGDLLGRQRQRSPEGQQQWQQQQKLQRQRQLREQLGRARALLGRLRQLVAVGMVIHPGGELVLLALLQESCFPATIQQLRLECPSGGARSITFWTMPMPEQVPKLQASHITALASSLPRLQHLTLQAKGLPPTSLSPLSALIQLHTLDLSIPAMDTLPDLSALTQITSLSLSFTIGQDMREWPVDAPKSLPSSLQHLTQLQELEYRWLCPNTAQWQNIEVLGQLTNLTSLAVDLHWPSEGSLPPEVFLLIATVRQLTGLRKLELAGVSLQDLLSELGHPQYDDDFYELLEQQPEPDTLAPGAATTLPLEPSPYWPVLEQLGVSREVSVYDLVFLCSVLPRLRHLVEVPELYVPFMDGDIDLAAKAVYMAVGLLSKIAKSPPAPPTSSDDTAPEHSGSGATPRLHFDFSEWLDEDSTLEEQEEDDMFPVEFLQALSPWAQLPEPEVVLLKCQPTIDALQALAAAIPNLHGLTVARTPPDESLAELVGLSQLQYLDAFNNAMGRDAFKEDVTAVGIRHLEKLQLTRVTLDRMAFLDLGPWPHGRAPTLPTLQFLMLALLKVYLSDLHYLLHAAANLEQVAMVGQVVLTHPSRATEADLQAVPTILQEMLVRFVACSGARAESRDRVNLVLNFSGITYPDLPAIMRALQPLAGVARCLKLGLRDLGSFQAAAAQALVETLPGLRELVLDGAVGLWPAAKEVLDGAKQQGLLLTWKVEGGVTTDRGMTDDMDVS